MALQSTRAACDLCGLERDRLPNAATVGGRERRFCCAGCSQVYQILAESGQLDPEAREAAPQFRWARESGVLSQSNGDAAPPPPLEARAVRAATLHLEGLWCASCGWLIERALRGVPGVLAARVLFVSDLLQLEYDPSRVSLDTLRERVAALGYRAAPFAEGSTGPRASQQLLIRMGAAAILAMNIMVLNLILNWDVIVPLDAGSRAVFPWVLLALTLPAVFWAGGPVLTRGGRALLAGRPNMESLISLSVLATLGFSIYVTVTGGYHVYYDTAAMLVTLILLGRFLETLARERANASVTALHRRLPRKARILVQGDERYVAVEALAVGDVVRVQAGETLPVDGQVIAGAATLDESMLSGEPRPVERLPGAAVVGGTRVAEGALDVRAQRLGEASVLGQILRYVSTALTRKSAAEVHADRLARVFVPGIVSLAAATFGASLLLGWEATPGGALLRGVTVMIIACPCVLAIATPIAMVAAVGGAAERGILIADSQVLERVGRLRAVLFDKTGTLTRGVFTLLEINAAGDEDALLARVAAAEARARHPVAATLRRAAIQRGLDLPPADGFHELDGRGVAAGVGDVEVVVGNRAALPAPPDAALDAWARQREAQGQTVIFAGWDGRCQGALALGDPLRPDACEALDRLRALGLHPHLVSGDAPATTEAVARQVGIDDWEGGLTPGEKADRVAALQAEGAAVAVVGDGVNDAPALARADVGIAMGSGAEVAMGAAEITLLSGDLGRLPDAIVLARRSLRVIKQNLFWAMFYNATAIPLAITGVLHPLVAAGAMLASSLTVTLNSLRLRRAAR